MNIHILGICGKMTAPLAIALKKQGHFVSGSDQDKIYPPFSTTLSQAKIPVNKPHPKPNLYIIGSAFKNQNKLNTEFESIKKSNIPYISATKYIAKHLIKPNSILVAGSYGKSSISAMLAFILKDSKHNPSYLFAAESLNKFPSLSFTDSDWSICEADESINGLDTQAKFLYYPIKYLILTSAQWEHKESYKTELDNFNAFKKLIINIPKDGLLIYNQLDTSINPLLKFTKCQAIPYTINKINHPFLFGAAFTNNFAAVKILCDYLKISTKKILEYKGLKNRLEIVANKKNIIFIDDFAQSAPRIQASISAIKNKYPKRPVKVILEPHASFLQYKSSITELFEPLINVSQIFLTKISFSKNKDKTTRISFADYKTIFGDKINYLPINSDLITTVISSLKPNDILIRFSSGGLDGQKSFHKIINFKT